MSRHLVVMFLLLVGRLAEGDTTEIQFLSGTDKDNTVPWRFYCTGGGRSNNVQTIIPVPSCWQTKGFGSYSYQNNPSSTTVGQYSTTFSVPSSWADKRIYLVYEGVLTDTATWINGQAVAVMTTNTVVTGPITNTNALLNDRAFDNTASTGPAGTGGIAMSTANNTLNLGTLNQFTLSAWVNPQVEISGNVFPRIIMVGATPNYDTSGANGTAFLCDNSGFELTVNTGLVNTPNGALPGTGWYFVAVTYDATLPTNNVNFYVGGTNTGATLFSTQTLLEGPVAFGASAYAYLMNRSSLNRAFDGQGDDFRIFNGALSQSTLDAVRASAVSNSAPTPPTALYQWNFNTTASGTTVTPNAGAGGTLTMEDSSGTATDLYSAAGLGVSGVANGYVTNTEIVNTEHQGGFYEFKYEVTTNVVAGASTNVLNVNVSEWSANASVNRAEREGDYWNFSGIFRPVYLEAMPQSNIQRLTVDAQAGGQINVNVFLSGISNNCLLVGSVTDSNNNPLGSPFTNTVPANATNVLLSAALPAPRPWSAEFPNLYTLTVQLEDANNVSIHTVTNVIGFRTVTFSNNTGYLINGQKVILRGICRHEFWPTDGRTTSQAESDLDIENIKSMNFNAVRMSHYPPNKIFLQECDRLGLYVFDELAGWQASYDNTIAPKLVQEMVIRDVNHPCVIAWDNGNEGGWNTTVDNDGAGATNVFAIWDPQNRHVNRPSSTFNNVQDDHYPSYSGFSGRLGSNLTLYLPTEILHGNYDGGEGASLSDYWDLLRAAPNGAGMFIWAYLDEGVVRDDEGGVVDVQDTAAPDGVVGPFRQPEASFYAIKSIYNPAQVTRPDPASFGGALAVSNRFAFTSLNQCTFDWQLGWYSDLNDAAINASTNALIGGLQVALDSGAFAGPNVAPGANGSLVLPGFPANGTNYDALRLTATDPLGNNLYTWTWPLRAPAQIQGRIEGAAPAGAPAISAGMSATEIILTNGPRLFHFGLATGMIDSLTVSNQTVSFSNGPVLVAGSWAISSITNYSDGTNYMIMVNNVNTSPNAFQWSLRPDGWLKLVYVYTLTGPQNYMGITFNYPSNKVTSMTWLGQGPYRVYKNRLAGQEVFVHTKNYNYTWTGQGALIAPSTTPWVYPEFEGYHGQLNWATLQTTELPISVVTPTANLFMSVLAPPITDQPNVNVPYPAGAISFLHGIPPQGDKFHAPSSYGPSASLNTAAGLYSGEVDFFFDQPPSQALINLTAAAGNGKVALSWTSLTGATNYSVKRSATKGAEVTIATTTTTGYTDSAVTNDATYYYEVSALNLAGQTVNSSEVTATPTAPTVPLAPTGLTATPGNGQAVLGWTASAGATNYNVKRSTTSGAEADIGSAATTGYTDTGLANGTMYYYVVSAMNSAGESGPSSEVSVTPAAAPSPVLQLRMPLDDAGPGTAAASDTSLGGMNITLFMFTNGTVAGNLHGAAGTGITNWNPGAGALDLTENNVPTQGTTEPGNTSGLGPILMLENNAPLATLGNNGVISNFIVTFWMNAVNNFAAAGANEPRLWVLGAGATAGDYSSISAMGMQSESASQLYFDFAGSQILQFSQLQNYPTFTWMFIAVSYDGTNFTAYYGTSAQAATAIQTVNAPGQTLNLGATASLNIGNSDGKGFQRSFNGWMSDFRFYKGTAGSSAATAAFVQQIQNQQTTPPLPPTLDISWNADQSQFSLVWLNQLSHYTLYATTNLSAANSWQAVTNAVSSTNGMSTVTLSLSGGEQFFRLRGP